MILSASENELVDSILVDLSDAWSEVPDRTDRYLNLARVILNDATGRPSEEDEVKLQYRLARAKVTHHVPAHRQHGVLRSIAKLSLSQNISDMQEAA